MKDRSEDISEDGNQKRKEEIPISQKKNKKCKNTSKK
jgi:hypothetical protein